MIVCSLVFNAVCQLYPSFGELSLNVNDRMVGGDNRLRLKQIWQAEVTYTCLLLELY